MEAWEKSGRTLPYDELLKIYEAEFTRSIEEQAEQTPNFEVWFGSGPYSGPVDIARRWSLGAQQLEDLIEYCTSHPDDKPWVTPDRTPAIELEFKVTLGGVEVRGFIDQVLETPRGLIVRDIKTGARPGDSFQLATYAEAIRLTYGVTPIGGDYLMGKTGKPTRLIEISPERRAAVHEAFKDLDKRIKAGEFEPTTDKRSCVHCSVRTACPLWEGYA